MFKTDYPASVHKYGDSFFYITRSGGVKVLAITNSARSAEAFEGAVSTDPHGTPYKVCPLNIANSKALRRIFPFTDPVSFKGRRFSVGLGDRLGLASPGHIRAVKGVDAFPVLAQQSMRELNLTGRTYDDVLAAAVWAVFQEGYENGYGADGDHLKTPAEISMALNSGFTMITLDCSEHIDNSAAVMSGGETDTTYGRLSAKTRDKYETKYLNRAFSLEGGFELKYPADILKQIVLTYYKAVNYMIEIYKTRIAVSEHPVDFEISIDETLTSTSPEAHYFVASELADAGVAVANIAPRFCGEFQKGIDYIGGIAQFKSEYAAHEAVAQHFGHRISVHSGSDKFSVFPYIGSISSRGFHLKTAGTNWLEAVRVISTADPVLYREMHAYALSRLDEASKYYHIKGRPENIAPLDSLSDDQLPSLMDLDDSRQVIHISYGTLLSAKNDDGSYVFRDRIYKVLDDHEDVYAEALVKHIGRHLKVLGIK